MLIGIIRTSLSSENITEPRSHIDQSNIRSMTILLIRPESTQCNITTDIGDNKHLIQNWRHIHSCPHTFSVCSTKADFGLNCLSDALFDHCHSEEVLQCLILRPPFRSEAPRNHSLTPFSMMACVALAVSGFFLTASGKQNKMMFDNIKLVILLINTFKVNSQ